MMKLPLSEKTEWGTGSSKNLPINQVHNIMLDLKYTKNWDIAMQNVPKRKLQQSRIDSQMKLKSLKKSNLFNCFMKSRTSNLTDKE